MAGPGTLQAPYGLAPLFTVHSGGDLWMYEHDDPAGGSFNWGDQQPIGSGWTGRTLAGPSGYLISITTGGSMRLLHFNGSNWDDMGGGAQYRTIASGWSYTSAQTRNRISIDEDGVIYTLDTTGALKASYYNVATQNWDVVGALLASGLTQYNSIVASSRGAVYARTPAGALYRYYINFWTNPAVPVLVQPTAAIGSGWNGFKSLSSPGGDLLYGVSSYDGNLYWYSYDPSSNSWAANYGYYIGQGWGSERDVVLQTNACTRFDTATTVSSTGPTDGGAVVRRLNAVKKN
ncbi:tachylectin-related carbohydrate-binding protein [Solihabitans fulvus]|nr:tachylectin-related carbohydrate-binding protein [Solihabitans fulvus]